MLPEQFAKLSYNLANIQVGESGIKKAPAGAFFYCAVTTQTRQAHPKEFPFAITAVPIMRIWASIIG